MRDARERFAGTEGPRNSLANVDTAEPGGRALLNTLRVDLCPEVEHAVRAALAERLPETAGTEVPEGLDLDALIDENVKSHVRDFRENLMDELTVRFVSHDDKLMARISDTEAALAAHIADVETKKVMLAPTSRTLRSPVPLSRVRRRRI